MSFVTGWQNALNTFVLQLWICEVSWQNKAELGQVSKLEKWGKMEWGDIFFNIPIVV